MFRLVRPRRGGLLQRHDNRILVRLGHPPDPRPHGQPARLATPLATPLATLRCVLTQTVVGSTPPCPQTLRLGHPYYAPRRLPSNPRGRVGSPHPRRRPHMLLCPPDDSSLPGMRVPAAAGMALPPYPPRVDTDTGPPRRMHRTALIPHPIRRAGACNLPISHAFSRLRHTSFEHVQNLHPSLPTPPPSPPFSHCSHTLHTPPPSSHFLTPSLLCRPLHSSR